MIVRAVSGWIAMLVLSASPVAAQFSEPTRCYGALVFLNPDFSFETYELAFFFDGDVYRLEALNRGSDETTSDVGRCTTYLATGCRHVLDSESDAGDAYYDFRLEQRLDGRYAYRETWADGAPGGTTLKCRPTRADQNE